MAHTAHAFPLQRADRRPDDFSRFYSDHVHRLRGYASKHFGSTHAEEITQATMERALEAYGTLDFARDPWPWLVTVARNIGLNVVRQESWQDLLAHDVVDVPCAAWAQPEVVIEAQENQALVREALCHLTAAHQRVLLLRLHEDMAFSSIAEMIGLTENAVRQQLFKARKSFISAYESLAASAPALAPWVIVLAGFKRLVREARRGTAPAATVGFAAVTALAIAGVVGLTQPEVETVRKPPDHPVTQTAGFAPERMREPLHSPADEVPGRRAASTAAVAASPPPAAPVADPLVVVRLAENPLGPGEVSRVVVKVDTPVGTLFFENETVNEAGGPVCEQALGLCS